MSSGKRSVQRIVKVARIAGAMLALILLGVWVANRWLLLRCCRAAAGGLRYRRAVRSAWAANTLDAACLLVNFVGNWHGSTLHNADTAHTPAGAAEQFLECCRR